MEIKDWATLGTSVASLLGVLAIFLKMVLPSGKEKAETKSEEADAASTFEQIAARSAATILSLQTKIADLEYALNQCRDEMVAVLRDNEEFKRRLDILTGGKSGQQSRGSGK